MWIRRQGTVEQDIYMLGTSEVPVYLIRHGATWTLVEGGGHHWARGSWDNFWLWWKTYPPLNRG